MAVFWWSSVLSVSMVTHKITGRLTICVLTTAVCLVELCYNLFVLFVLGTMVEYIVNDGAQVNKNI